MLWMYRNVSSLRRGKLMSTGFNVEMNKISIDQGIQNSYVIDQRMYSENTKLIIHLYSYIHFLNKFKIFGYFLFISVF